MRKIICFFILFAVVVNIYAQNNEDTEVIKRVADYVLTHTEFTFADASGEVYQSTKNIPQDVEVKFTSPFEEWHYTMGVLNMSLVNLSAFLNDDRYFDFAAKHIAFGMDNYKFFQKRFKNDRHHSRFPFGQLWTMEELDDFGAIGASMIDINEKVHREDYKEYILNGAKRISEGQVRLKDRTLMRHFPHELTLWADDLYMSVPFLVRLARFTGEEKYMDDAILQVKNFDKYLWHAQKGIYYHCYYSDLERNGIAHWGRCNGWVMMAKVHLLNHMADDHPEKANIIKDLQKQILGVAKYQNGEGLWHQLLDKTDSYTESSCSAMFVYGIARAVNQGWIDKRYASIALNGWAGLKKLKITDDGQVKDICVGTGIQDDLVFYYQRPARTNEKHGIGAVIDAGIEIIKLKQSLKR
jgi:unsaturated rhamnogalacturonyl hydrolase